MQTGWAKQFGSAAIAAFLAVGCSGTMPGSSHGHMGMAQAGSPNGATSATKAAELAHAALDRAATPAGRTTSLPTPPRAADQVPASGAA